MAAQHDPEIYCGQQWLEQLAQKKKSFSSAIKARLGVIYEVVILQILFPSDDSHFFHCFLSIDYIGEIGLHSVGLP